MSSSHRVSYPRVVAGVLLTILAPLGIAVGQSSTAVSPFVSYVPSAARNPLVGMALTFGGTTGLALRASADMSIDNPEKASATDPTVATSGGVRPWGADADAILFLGGLGGGATVFSRSLSPYVFSGIGLTGRDSAGTNVVRNGWSYGAGAAIPLGFNADLFGEARWRMPEYVLPTSKSAPSSTSEFRFGLSFHVGGGGGSREGLPAPSPRRGGRRMDDYEDVSVVVPASAPATATAINVNVPTVPTASREEEAVVANPAETQAERRAPAVSSSRVLTTTRTTTTRSSRGIVYRSRAASSRSTSSRSTSSATSTRSVPSTRTPSASSTSCRSSGGSIGSVGRRQGSSCTTSRRVMARRRGE